MGIGVAGLLAVGTLQARESAPFSGSVPLALAEAVDSGRADGTIVSLNKPAGGANQKWIITPREERLHRFDDDGRRIN